VIETTGHTTASLTLNTTSLAPYIYPVLGSNCDNNPMQLSPEGAFLTLETSLPGAR